MTNGEMLAEIRNLMDKKDPLTSSERDLALRLTLASLADVRTVLDELLQAHQERDKSWQKVLELSEDVKELKDNPVVNLGAMIKKYPKFSVIITLVLLAAVLDPIQSGLAKLLSLLVGIP